MSHNKREGKGNDAVFGTRRLLFYYCIMISLHTDRGHMAWLRIASILF